MQALERTNIHRKKHRVFGLKDNRNAQNIAQNYAQKLNSQFEFKHNPELSRLKLGENLFTKMQSRPFSLRPSDCEKYAVEAIDRFLSILL
jgi:hypothetical protein